MPKLTTFTPEKVAEMVGATAWWVREQAKNRNVPHIRAGQPLPKSTPTCSATTMNIYSHVTPTMQKAAVDRFAQHLKNA